MKPTILHCAVLTCFACAAAAAEPAPAENAAESGPGGQSLGQAAEDPTASLMSVQLADWYTLGYRGLDDDANTFVVRSAIPFQTGSLSHIFRITVPFITDHPILDAGLSDITVFDLMVFNEGWGRWGIGPVALLPAGGSNHGAEKWGAGPAIGFTARSGKTLWGAFNQNIFSFAGDDARADVNVSILQPILSRGLGHGWSMGTSEMNFTYDWESDRWVSLPLGIKVAKMTKLGKQPVQFSLQYEHDFADEPGVAEDTLRFTAKFLFPTKSAEKSGK